MSIQWPEQIALAMRPTPLQPLTKLSKKLGGPLIWVKRDDLTGSVLTGNKVRKLEFLTAYAKQHGYDSLVTCGGIQSNHCRATALVGAQLDMKVQLVLRGEQTPLDGNQLLDYLAGASVSYYPQKGFSQHLISYLNCAANDLRSQGFNPYIIPTGGSNGVGVWGYFAATEELKSDLKRENIKPEAIITATGSGGTQAGLTLGSAYFEMNCPVIGMAVCDSESWFKHKIKDDIQSFSEEFGHCLSDPIPHFDVITNDHYIGEGYALASDEVLNCIAWVAREEGIVFDPVYSGKAFYGLTEEIRQGTFKSCQNVVFIHTGGSYGLFPYRQDLNRLLAQNGPK